MSALRKFQPIAEPSRRMPFIELPLSNENCLVFQTCLKSELAEKYNITTRTLIGWIKPIMNSLVAAGYQKNTKRLSPKMVKLIVDLLGEPFTDI